jgi:hypothetical protein
MVRDRSQLVLAILSASIVAGCASDARHGVQGVAEMAGDSDLVIMPGALGGADGAKLAGVAAMTRGEIVDCAKLITNIEQKSVRLKSEHKQLEANRVRLEAFGRSLELDRARVNTHSAKDVAAFNRRMEDHQSQIRSQNSSVTSYNAEANAGIHLNNSFNTSCAGRAYRQSDLALVPADVRDVINRHSRTSDIPIISEESRDAEGNTVVHIGR